MFTLSALSTEYIPIQVSASVNGQSGYNPTSDAVSMAFINGTANPQTSDWHTASWQTYSSPSGASYIAVCLVGPTGGVVLSVGTYNIWLKITDSPEVPVRQVGILQIV